MAQASHEVNARQQPHVAIPKRFGMPMREIWALQPRLERHQGRRPMALLGHPRFRAAYDFLLLRAEAGEVDPEIAEWWTRFQDVDAAERARMTTGSAKRKRRRRRRPKAASGDGEPAPQPSSRAETAHGGGAGG
jgi:poly(A) polymerase